MSGGIFNDYNIHNANLIHWHLKSQVKHVWSLVGAYLFKEFQTFQDTDNATALCELENGIIAYIGGSHIASFGHETRTEIVYTHENLQISDHPAKNRMRISYKNGIHYEYTETFYERFERVCQTQIRYFCQYVENNIQPELIMASDLKNSLIIKSITN